MPIPNLRELFAFDLAALLPQAAPPQRLRPRRHKEERLGCCEASVVMERCGSRLRFYDMMKRWIAVLLVAAPLSVAAANVMSFPRVPPYLPVPKGSVVILNTGSTNSAGYRIVVQTNASAEYVTASGRNTTEIPKDLASKMFSDLKAAAPLQNLLHVACMKSASFGTSVFIWWNHERSPDLTCPADSQGRALLDDATKIAAALHISSGLRQPIMRPMLPGEKHKPLPPVPSPSPQPQY